MEVYFQNKPRENNQVDVNFGTDNTLRVSLSICSDKSYNILVSDKSS